LALHSRVCTSERMRIALGYVGSGGTSGSSGASGEIQRERGLHQRRSDRSCTVRAAGWPWVYTMFFGDPSAQNVFPSPTRRITYPYLLPAKTTSNYPSLPSRALVAPNLILTARHNTVDLLRFEDLSCPGELIAWPRGV
jgi:hypothetical protein